MGLFSKKSKDDDKRMMEDEKGSYFAVKERLEQLVKKGVITHEDLSFKPVVRKGRNIPQLIATIERLMQEGHLKGIEDCIMGFCYHAGSGMVQQSDTKKQ